jgi:cation transport protein ChaC
MWVFAYGSLMWDGWEHAYECSRRVKGTLSGYRRVFNKPSVRNWGTTQRPCPTLNLIKSATSRCHGLAFEFGDDRKNDISAYLATREGRGFILQRLTVRLDNSRDVIATVAIYQGKKLIPTLKRRVSVGHVSIT